MVHAVVESILLNAMGVELAQSKEHVLHRYEEGLTGAPSGGGSPGGG